MNLSDRISLYSRADVATGCQIWTGACNKFGYGKITVAGRTLGAHRVAFEIARGPIPPGMFVCHKCDVRNCIKPSHLFIGTAADNMADKVAKARQAKGVATAPRRPAHGERNCNAKLRASDIPSIRADTRIQSEIAADYAVTQTVISSIKSGRTWAHVPEAA